MNEQRRSRRSRTVARYLPVVAMLVFCGVTTGILVSSHGLPYVTDGNESFSAYTHARNMLRWGLALTAGLTDEANASEQAAHPYVYTHEGNFPRFFSWLLLLLGVRAIEWHIVLAAFLIGGASTYLCYRLFAHIADSVFALIVCLVLWSNYILFVQWQVNTYRVWHALFLFASLSCVHLLNDTNKKHMFVLLLANSVALFYYEYVFAVFVVLFSIGYAVIAYRGQLTRVLWVIGAIASGAAISIALFIAQLFGHFGTAIATQDIHLTYFARNFARGISTEELRNQVMRFYLDHHIVFWDVFDTTRYLTVSAFLHSVIPTVLQVYTPFFVLATGIVNLGVVMSGIAYWLTARRVAAGNRTGISGPRDRAGGGSPAGALVTWGTLAVGFYIVLGVLGEAASSQFSIILHDQRMTFRAIGLVHQAFGPFNALQAAAAIGLSGLVATLVMRGTAPGRGVPGVRLAIAVTFFELVVSYMLTHRLYYNFRAVALWYWAAQAFWPARVLQAGLVTCVLLGTCAIFGCADRTLWRSRGRQLAGVFRYLLAGSVAFIGTYLVFPGYLFGGYLIRYTPIPVFVSDVLVALFFYVVVSWGRDSGKEIVRWVRRERDRGSAPASARVRTPVPAMVFCLLTVMLIGFTSAYWLRVQGIYVANLPPTAILFLKRLGDSGFRGASFVSSNYALPVAYFTGRWAYQDQDVGQNKDVATAGGHRLEVSGKYIWFADRTANSQYLQPEYYLCRIDPTLDTVASLVALAPGKRLSNCSAEPIFQDARSGAHGVFQHRVVGSDPSPVDGWSIIKLDEHAPFYATTRAVAH